MSPTAAADAESIILSDGVATPTCLKDQRPISILSAAAIALAHCVHVPALVSALCACPGYRDR